MKWIFPFLIVFTTSLCFAQAPDLTPPANAPPVAAPAPTIQAPSTAVIPPAFIPQTVAVSQNSAPPAWIQELLETVAALPIVGPYVSKALVYLEALGACLTALVVFLLALSASLKGVVNFSGLTTLANAIETFQQSKFMYYLTAISNIPVHITPAQAAAPPSGQAPGAKA